jgi:asparagine N-glycosylation enzyme membrane subunit Stt3
MSPKERRTILLILSGSLLAGLLLAWQPAVVGLKIGLVAGVVLLPVAMLRAALYTCEACRKRRFVLAVLGGLLTVLLFLGLLGESGKLLTAFSG